MVCLDSDSASPAIADFCRRWGITKLEVFGSFLRDDFGSNSDVDFLVSFAPDVRLSLFDLVRAEAELGKLVGCRADLVERKPVEQSSNWIRRNAILNTAKCIYVA